MACRFTSGPRRTDASQLPGPPLWTSDITMSKNPTRWYNLIAPLYDLAVTGVYTRARRATARQLRLEAGQTVLDVACGTGENFRYILAEIGPAGTLIGTDYSEGMLGQARRKVERNRWSNVRLMHADARTLSLASLRSELSLPDLRVDRVVCTLGFSVIPEWKTVFERTWDLLAPGGRYAILDWYSPDRTLFTRFANRIAAGDIHRRWWEPLEQRALEFERERMFRGMVFMVAGSKPVSQVKQEQSRG
ncbi:MAG TPA: hypothetical protein DEP84_20285 [Chloroflexi bacterium]|nr:hypothetical protein [Chloroflexota bacterium]